MEKGSVKRGARGRFAKGTAGGPGRPPGVPAFEKALRELLSDPKELKKFAKKFGEMLVNGDPTAWQLAMKRGWVEPAKGIDLGGNVTGKIMFGWKKPRTQKKVTKKKATRKKL